jgi:hypothetical protein
MNLKNQYLNDQVFYYWLVGLFEADGCFSVNHKGEIRFDLYQHSLDVGLLYQIKTRLLCGYVHTNSNKSVDKLISTYTVYSIKHFKILYPIFNQRILSEYKYNQFKKICDIVGVEAIRGDHNHLSWLTGFTDGKGSFFIDNTEKQITANYSLSQKKREVLDIIKIKYFENWDSINDVEKIGSKHNEYYILRFICTNMEFVNSFMKYRLLTKKRLDFENWCQVVKLIQQKEHLTPQGIAKIEKINLTLNKKKI